MLDDLLDARPVYIALPLRGDRPSKLIGEFDEKLRADARIGERYERRELPGKLLYVRRDAKTGLSATRLKVALARLPGFRFFVLERFPDLRDWITERGYD